MQIKRNKYLNQGLLIGCICHVSVFNKLPVVGGCHDSKVTITCALNKKASSQNLLLDCFLSELVASLFLNVFCKAWNARLKVTAKGEFIREFKAESKSDSKGFTNEHGA